MESVAVEQILTAFFALPTFKNEHFFFTASPF